MNALASVSARPGPAAGETGGEPATPPTSAQPAGSSAMKRMRAFQPVEPVHLREAGSACVPTVRRLEACRQPGCACHGRGTVTLLAACSADLLESYAEQLMSECNCMQTAGSSRLCEDAPAAISVFYGDRLLCSMPPAPAGTVFATTVLFELPSLHEFALSAYIPDAGQQIMLIHQAAGWNEVERSLQQTLPPDAIGSEPHTVSLPGLLLLVQEGGWAVGDFLARAALLKQRELWRARAGKT